MSEECQIGGVPDRRIASCPESNSGLSGAGRNEQRNHLTTRPLKCLLTSKGAKRHKYPDVATRSSRAPARAALTTRAAVPADTPVCVQGRGGGPGEAAPAPLSHLPPSGEHWQPPPRWQGLERGGTVGSLLIPRGGGIAVMPHRKSGQQGQTPREAPCRRRTGRRSRSH